MRRRRICWSSPKWVEVKMDIRITELLDRKTQACVQRCALWPAMVAVGEEPVEIRLTYPLTKPVVWKWTPPELGATGALLIEIARKYREIYAKEEKEGGPLKRGDYKRPTKYVHSHVLSDLTINGLIWQPKRRRIVPLIGS